MKTRRLATLLLMPLLCLGSVPVRAAPARAPAAKKPASDTALAVKKVADRYALTKARISNLLDQRLQPTPLPNDLPNPFYHPPALPATGPAAVVETTQVPAAPDVSDGDTLAKFVSTLRIGGTVVLNGQPRLTLNDTLCKVGDVIPVVNQSRTAYIQVLAITADKLTLGLNDAQQTVSLRPQ